MGVEATFDCFVNPVHDSIQSRLSVALPDADDSPTVVLETRGNVSIAGDIAPQFMPPERRIV